MTDPNNPFRQPYRDDPPDKIGSDLADKHLELVRDAVIAHRAHNVDAIRNRWDGIAPGQWKAFNYAEWEDDALPPDDAWWLEGFDFVEYDVYSLFNEADAKRIAHAPADIRALLRQHDADQERIASLEAALKRITDASRTANEYRGQFDQEVMALIATFGVIEGIANRILKGGDDE